MVHIPTALNWIVDELADQEGIELPPPINPPLGHFVNNRTLRWYIDRANLKLGGTNHRLIFDHGELEIRKALQNSLIFAFDSGRQCTNPYNEAQYHRPLAIGWSTNGKSKQSEQ